MQVQAYVAGVVGAVLGGAVGYLCFTKSGRVKREHITRGLDQLVADTRDLRAFWLELLLVGEEFQQRRAMPFVATHRPPVNASSSGRM